MGNRGSSSAAQSNSYYGQAPTAGESMMLPMGPQMYSAYGAPNALYTPFQPSIMGPSMPQTASFAYPQQDPFGGVPRGFPTAPTAPVSQHTLHPAQARLQGSRRAVLIGINYVGQQVQLKGCHNDVQSIASFLQAIGWQPHEIMILIDSPTSAHQPTHDNILAAFRWLSQGTMPGDVRFLHFSGHAGLLPGSGGSMTNLDQAIYPVDHMNGKRRIRDNVIYSEVIFPLPHGSRLTIVMDCCHSGDILNLPYQYVAHQFEMTKYYDNGRRIPGMPNPLIAELDYRRPLSSGLRLIPQIVAGRIESRLDGPGIGGPEGWRATGAAVPAADVLTLSSCKSWQVSSDLNQTDPSYSNFDGNSSGGAMTYILATVLNELVYTGGQISLLDLLERIREYFQQKGLLQVPILSSSALLDINAPFTLHTTLPKQGQQAPTMLPMASPSVFPMASPGMLPMASPSMLPMASPAPMMMMAPMPMQTWR